jgi:hypothetical protein
MHGFQQDDIILPSRLYHVHVDSIILMMMMMMRYTRFTHLSIAQIVCRFFHNKQSPLQPTDSTHTSLDVFLLHVMMVDTIKAISGCGIIGYTIVFGRYISRGFPALQQSSKQHPTTTHSCCCWQQAQFFNLFLCTSQNGCTKECCCEEYQLFW